MLKISDKKIRAEKIATVGKYSQIEGYTTARCCNRWQAEYKNEFEIIDLGKAKYNGINMDLFIKIYRREDIEEVIRELYKTADEFLFNFNSLLNYYYDINKILAELIWESIKTTGIFEEKNHIFLRRVRFEEFIKILRFFLEDADVVARILENMNDETSDYYTETNKNLMIHALPLLREVLEDISDNMHNPKYEKLIRNSQKKLGTNNYLDLMHKYNLKFKDLTSYDNIRKIVDSYKK